MALTAGPMLPCPVPPTTLTTRFRCRARTLSRILKGEVSPSSLANSRTFQGYSVVMLVSAAWKAADTTKRPLCMVWGETSCLRPLQACQQAAPF